MELFEGKVEDFYTRLKGAIYVLNEYVKKDSGLSVNSDISALNKCRDKASDLYVVVQQSYSEFVKFLESTNTRESEAEITRVDNMFMEGESQVKEYLSQIKRLRSEKIEVMSNVSSTSDSVTTMLFKKAAEAKAAKLKLEFAAKEIELKRQKEIELKMQRTSALLKQADLDAEIEMLHQQKEAAALAVEAEELRKICRTSNSAGSVSLQLPDEQEDKMNSVKNYIEKHPPLYSQQMCTFNENNNISQFLLRKDLILSCISNFNDCSDNYRAWKASFKSVCEEMNLNSNEETDLLVKYLGPTSKKYALSLRSAYLHDSNEAVAKIWARLDERYGSAETVMNTLTVKLKQFPCLTNKDVTKLFDLSDILAEVEGLMENPSYAASFAYFNWAVGVNPIVAKLPYNLQQRWISCCCI